MTAGTCPLRYLRYLVYKVKMKTDQYKEDNEHYLYDIFVCYSQADRQWVFEHLVARLEDGGRYVPSRCRKENRAVCRLRWMGKPLSTDQGTSHMKGLSNIILIYKALSTNVVRMEEFSKAKNNPGKFSLNSTQVIGLEVKKTISLRQKLNMFVF